jgi:hypothetical protein
MTYADILNESFTYNCRLERACRMALSAVCPKSAMMYVLGFVTGVTSGGRRDRVNIFGHVAGIAAS